ncbi:MAG: hypothetical protein CMJ31_11635 [Phycisphaerae bacterium]|nr:hypothetical protein [Phycisphaerae bacterium]
MPPNRAAAASGVLNAVRQVGGAHSVAAFRAFLAAAGTVAGMRIGLSISALLLVVTTLASLKLLARGPRSPAIRPSESTGDRQRSLGLNGA